MYIRPVREVARTPPSPRTLRPLRVSPSPLPPHPCVRAAPSTKGGEGLGGWGPRGSPKASPVGQGGAARTERPPMPEPVAVAFVIFGVAAAACLLVATGRMLYVLWLESAYVEEEPLTLSPTLPSDVSPEEAAAIRAALEGDAAMLRRDWEAVGSDMRRAMERLDKEIAEGRFP